MPKQTKGALPKQTFTLIFLAPAGADACDDRSDAALAARGAWSLAPVGADACDDRSDAAVAARGAWSIAPAGTEVEFS